VPEKLAGEAGEISGLEVVDEHTLRVTLDAPKVYFLAKLIMPVAFVVDRRQVAGSDWDRAANGSGPFRLQTWEDDEIVILARNEDYYGGAPDAAHIVYLIGAGIPLSLYENGTTDLVYVGGSDVERMRDPNNPLSADLRTGISFCTTYVGFNTRLPPFDNPDVRRAFVMGLDREQLVATLYQGQGLLANGPIPPGMPGYTGQTGLLHDPAAARALLAQAGLDTLPPLTFSTGGYIDAGALVTALITRWQENLGATISPELIDAFTYIDALYAGEVGHLFTFSWCADYPDPENMVDVLFHSQSPLNIGGFDDPETDALLEQARTETDVDARLALYAAAERRVIEQGAAVFLAHNLDAALVSERLGGFELTPVSVPQLHRVELGQGR
jgi:ABC-type transport system substrate-binding protein